MNLREFYKNVDRIEEDILYDVATKNIPEIWDFEKYKKLDTFERLPLIKRDAQIGLAKFTDYLFNRAINMNKRFLMPNYKKISLSDKIKFFRFLIENEMVSTDSEFLRIETKWQHRPSFSKLLKVNLFPTDYTSPASFVSLSYEWFQERNDWDVWSLVFNQESPVECFAKKVNNLSETLDLSRADISSLADYQKHGFVDLLTGEKIIYHDEEFTENELMAQTFKREPFVSLI